MPNYVSLTESQRRKIAVFITESQQQAQQLQQQQQRQQQSGSSGDDSVIASSSLSGSPTNQIAPITGANSISCKEIVQFCKVRFGLTISLSTASRLRSTAAERLATELLNPSAKRHRSVKFPEFEKALVQELRALEQEQIQMQQEQERQNAENGLMPPYGGDQGPLPPVMMLTSEAAITQVAKGIAERMGIPVTELGLTSGWYHGFKRRHGIKHRQFKARSSGSGSPASGLGGPTLGSIGSGAGDGSGGVLETGDGSDGPDADVDEEMDDVGPDAVDLLESKVSGTKRAAVETTALKPLRKRVLATPPPNLDTTPSIDLGSGSILIVHSAIVGEGSSADAGTSSTGPLLNISSIVLTPKEPPASSLSRRPEVKKVTAATANDALDVISEYLLQNGQIGATKLPLVKELRKFLLAQTEIENGSSSSGVLLGVGVPPLSSGQSSPGMHACLMTEGEENWEQKQQQQQQQ